MGGPPRALVDTKRPTPGSAALPVQRTRRADLHVADNRDHETVRIGQGKSHRTPFQPLWVVVERDAGGLHSVGELGEVLLGRDPEALADALGPVPSLREVILSQAPPALSMTNWITPSASCFSVISNPSPSI